MNVLELIPNALKVCARAVLVGQKIQEPARKRLVDDLQQICSKCEDAYGAVLARLKPVKEAFSDPKRLATELRAFAADVKTRNQFKPEHLCYEVDQLLMDLDSHLSPLSYSIDLGRVRSVHKDLRDVGDFDAAIHKSYDDFTRNLDQLAVELEDPQSDTEERASYAQQVMRGFEEDLRSAIDGVREAKRRILHGPQSN